MYGNKSNLFFQIKCSIKSTTTKLMKLHSARNYFSLY